jgi:catechol 1,2-dioxygenase
MERRNFIQRAGLVTLGGTIPPFFFTVADSKAIQSDLLNSCIPTTADILGPFYIANAPVRERIIPETEEGDFLRIEGRVLDEDCNPVHDAEVEVWHCDSEGEYDLGSPDLWYRGRYFTDSDGSYAFDTIIPGRYLNGAEFRPSHLHFRVSSRGFSSRITQLYFADDPFIESDPWASDPEAEHRILELQEVEDGYLISFDFVIRALVSVKEFDLSESNLILNNPVSDRLIMSIIDGSILDIEFFDTQGKILYRKYGINQKEVDIDMKAYKSGNYFIRVRSTKGISVHAVVKI